MSRRTIRSRLPVLPFIARHVVGNFAAFFLVPAEDHFTSCRLQHAGNGRLYGLAYHLPGIVHNDHRAVIEVRDALIEFLKKFESENAK